MAAAGNNGCECLHVPAALPAVLAVGAMDWQEQPLDISNWGKTYQTQGILAPGENILGAKPGEDTIRLSGTSFATPIVTGVAALLLSLQRQHGDIDPQKIRTALLKTAIPCNFNLTGDRRRCLVGKLNITGALKYLTGEIMSKELQTIEASGCGCNDNDKTETEVLANTAINNSESEQGLEEVKSAQPLVAASAVTKTQTTFKPSANFVSASQAPSDISEASLVYALGTLGYDFGSEARRDSFKQYYVCCRTRTRHFSSSQSL